MCKFISMHVFDLWFWFSCLILPVRVLEALCACAPVHVYVCVRIAKNSFYTLGPSNPYCEGQVYLRSVNHGLLTPDICWGQAVSSQWWLIINWMLVLMFQLTTGRRWRCVVYMCGYSTSSLTHPLSVQIPSCLQQTCSKDCGYTCTEQSMTLLSFQSLCLFGFLCW